MPKAKKPIEPAEAKPIGRPSSYSDEMANKICEWIGSGKSLLKFCEIKGHPSQSMVYNWLMKYPAFQENYARARAQQQDVYAEEIITISDEEPRMIMDEKGALKVDPAWITWTKNRVDARKWYASKLAPAKYGDRIDVQAKVDMTSGPSETLLSVIAMAEKQYKSEN